MNIIYVKDAIRAVKRAQEELRAAVAETWPIGADIHWDKGGHRQYGRVVCHPTIGRNDELMVENTNTKKQYWITMYDVLGYVS